VAAPFLDFADFEAQFGRDLSDAEAAVAQRLLQVVSDWIRGQKADVDALTAAEVVFEVTRDAINYGALERLSTFANTTGGRSEAGSFDNSRQLAKEVVDDYVTDRQKRLLGIPLRAAPAYNFPVCDY
jgi:hypothetical protein